MLEPSSPNILAIEVQPKTIFPRYERWTAPAIKLIFTRQCSLDREMLPIEMFNTDVVGGIYE